MIRRRWGRGLGGVQTQSVTCLLHVVYWTTRDGRGMRQMETLTIFRSPASFVQAGTLEKARCRFNAVKYRLPNVGWSPNISHEDFMLMTRLSPFRKSPSMHLFPWIYAETAWVTGLAKRSNFLNVSDPHTSDRRSIYIQKIPVLVILTQNNKGTRDLQFCVCWLKDLQSMCTVTGVGRYLVIATVAFGKGGNLTYCLGPCFGKAAWTIGPPSPLSSVTAVW